MELIRLCKDENNIQIVGLYINVDGVLPQNVLQDDLGFSVIWRSKNYNKRLFPWNNIGKLG